MGSRESRERRRRGCRDRGRYVVRRIRRGVTPPELWALLIFLLFGGSAPRPDLMPEPVPAGGGRRVGVTVSTGNRYGRRPSYRRLISDLSRPAAEPEAVEVLRRRVPEEVLPWLDDVLRRHDLAALKTLVPPGTEDEKAELGMLRATLSWLREQEEDEEEQDGDDDGPTRPRPRHGQRGVNYRRP
jgi:hypothetical protein